MISPSMVEKAARFFIDEGEGLFREDQYEELKSYIIAHIIYGTLKVFEENGEILAAARWNWVGDNQVHILDVAVKKEHRHRGIVRILARRCLTEHPQCIGIFYDNKELTKKLYRPRSYFFKRGRIENEAFVKN